MKPLQKSRRSTHILIYVRVRVWAMLAFGQHPKSGNGGTGRYIMQIYYVTSVQVIDIHLTASPVASCMMALSGLAGRDYPLQQSRCLLLLLRCKCWCTLMLFIVTILNIPAAVCIQCSRTSDSSRCSACNVSWVCREPSVPSQSECITNV